MADKYSVLIVDDDPVLLKMTGELLRKDYAVSCVKSGQAALQLLQTDYEPDIILLDVDMPCLSGFDTCQELHRQEKTKDVPVIFLTGVTRTEAELTGLSCGGVDYIRKPFVGEVLLARLKIHLENSKRWLQNVNTGREGGIDEEKFRRISDDLNDTEKKVLRLIVLGYTNQEIGEELSYSYNYVKKVVGIIYEKKNVNRRSDLKKLFQ
ncbi:LuxR family two component transcriptional regulator [Kineothrix alysoides]|uniref:Stage 0 sporulation protein A homolog n=1 Tax=Kineothrix alysoides TaxID=1469948 RepID=A0A4R1R147_9FIRM|nr:response regulator [Kineothrix alysoides]TCL59045.1 LuxR family two component transcriptional regulator [Kineothrix alysoides]